MDQPYILAPQIVKVGFDLQPVYNGLQSLHELNDLERLSGLGDWVSKTASLLTPEERQNNVLVFEAFFPVTYGSFFMRHDQPDFPSFIRDVQALDPVSLRDQTVEVIVNLRHKYPHHWTGTALFTAEQFMNEREIFNSVMAKVMECEEAPDMQLLERAYVWYSEPELAHAEIVAYLNMMWTEHLKPEWDRVLPMLQESVTAYRQIGLPEMTVADAIKAVTGRDMLSKLDAKELDTDEIRFIPNAHIGPYVAKLPDNRILNLIFGARLPRESRIASAALSRSELLVRLNALADDVRLRILELLTQHDELCAQDIIEQLGLSQSSASRHLSQLSATGYLVERRREVSKCYSLNPERVNDTARALTQYLSRGQR